MWLKWENERSRVKCFVITLLNRENETMREERRRLCDENAWWIRTLYSVGEKNNTNEDAISSCPNSQINIISDHCRLGVELLIWSSLRYQAQIMWSLLQVMQAFRTDTSFKRSLKKWPRTDQLTPKERRATRVKISVFRLTISLKLSLVE